MSRWSAERLRIGLAPGRVDVAWLGTRLGRQAPRELGADCTPVAGQPPWQAALDALDTLQAPLAGLRLRGQAAAVVLSNHFVRYLVLPWQADLGGAAELEQWARLHFEQTFGAAAAQWMVRICDDGWGRPQVACAVDQALVDQIGTRLAGLGLRLASLQPLLMAAYNDARRELKGPTAFAIVEAGRLCLSLLERQGFGDISSRRVGSSAAEAIAQELATRQAQAQTQAQTQAQAPQLDVLLVGDAAPWPAHDAPAARLLGPLGPQGSPGRRTLAMCGAT